METDNYREKLQNVISSSEDHFEQKLSYISAGALGLSLTFIEKIIPLDNSAGLIFLILGWVFLVLTLLLNLISHMVSKYYSMKSRIEYDLIPPNESVKVLYNTVIARNFKTDLINWVTVSLLVFGISFVVVFASLNAFNKINKYESKQKIDKYEIDATNSQITTYQVAIDTSTEIIFTFKN